jgi:ABC-2 type transport system ATP-binding protein
MTCDRVLIINQGRVVATGTPGELRRDILGHSLYKLEVSGDLEALPAALHAVEPTLKVTEQTGPDPLGFHTLRLVTDRDDSIGEALLRTLVNANIPRWKTSSSPPPAAPGISSMRPRAHRNDQWPIDQ